MEKTGGELSKVSVCLSPVLFYQYAEQLDSDCIVVVIDVLRATTTIASALNNGASGVKAVSEVSECIEVAAQLNGVAGGEREGKVAPGLEHGNSPLEYTRELLGGRPLVLTTTNGTRLLNLAQKHSPKQIITGAFVNLDAVVTHIRAEKKLSESNRLNVVLACAGWRDSVCLEDSMFAGAVVSRLRETGDFQIQCDSAQTVESLYNSAKSDLYENLKSASHFQRLAKLNLFDDLRFCLTPSTINLVPLFNVDTGLLISKVL
ncbi:hypothetical protein PPL_05971 [Heterostelium album PN500]|uniref:2-phosphosulfolactate phosphatase n=1 Tax=Heterostelium pallidum (strain ATCC 26659 / Pp 5 / PN500) TaxID=670386 RepID=D3BBV1_HETP5|nr:hypothetical protein PPL_05971 [Heterostelium album PN500]EFA81134.1 hypothetical protein PPL_05971 [Heterostelium album PN500]|eukprot:XP_020433252.1 hypothetical protein PPL_05971 [Heterostelium album PN500]